MLPAHSTAVILDRYPVHLGMLILMLYHVYTSFTSASLGEVLGGVFLGHCWGDIISAILHYVTEFFPAEKWQWEHMETVIAYHHTDVLNYVDFNVGDKLTLAYPFVGPAGLLLMWYAPAPLYQVIWTVSLLCVLSIAFVHDWAHLRAHNCPLPHWIKRLQDYRLILHPSGHNRHHFVNSNSHYGVFSGNMNWLTNLFLIKPARFHERFDLERKRVIKHLIGQRQRILQNTHMENIMRKEGVLRDMHTQRIPDDI